LVSLKPRATLSRCAQTFRVTLATDARKSIHSDSLSNALSQNEISVTRVTRQNANQITLHSRRMQREIHMRKTTFFVAAVASLVLLGAGTWIGIRTLTPKSAVAGPADNAPVMTTGAKGLPTSPYDDYDIVVH
jgi:hypothetical protein